MQTTEEHYMLHETTVRVKQGVVFSMGIRMQTVNKIWYKSAGGLGENYYWRSNQVSFEDKHFTEVNEDFFQMYF